MKSLGKGQAELVLSVTKQIEVVMGYMEPFVGWMSDSMPDRYATMFGGRRRPFIVVGQLISALGTWMTYKALFRALGATASTDGMWVELFAGIVLVHLGGNISGPAWSAVVPETVLPRQRGSCVMIQSWSNQALGVVGAFVTFMAGQSASYVTPRDLWMLGIAIMLGVIPIYWLGCSGQACDGCTWRGLFKPERHRPGLNQPRPHARGSGTVRERQSRCGRGCCRERLREFTMAFREPAFR